MAHHDDDEDRLRAVALQNAQSVLLARRQAEEDLRRQSEWLRITLASIADGVVSTDVEGRITFMNPVAETETGWTFTEASGKPVADVLRMVHDQTREPVANPAWHSLAEGKVAVLPPHTVLLARDGMERPIDGSAAPIRDESRGAVGVVLVFRDVTQRRRADLAQAMLASIVESSSDAIVSKNLDGIIQSWNAGAQRLFGYTPEEALGKSITLIIPNDRLDEERAILEKLRRGQRVEHFETVRIAKDGRRIDISVTISPVRNAEGEIVGASKVARDVTERKRADAQLRESEAALRDSDRKKDDFIALLAHELRNPLAPLRNGLQILQIVRDPAAAAEARNMMERQMTHMVRLIDDLLDVSRIGRNKMELRRGRLVLADVVNSAVETARPLIDSRGHTLLVSLPPEPILLDADLTRLAQVFGNLLTNSAKYTDPAGKIWLSAAAEGECVRVTVQDTGIGIPQYALTNIFDMFSQVDRSIERSTGGLGIGLALVKGLVEMHGGTVEAASPGPGKGSTFSVRLPRLVEHADDAPEIAPDPTRPASAAKRRILVVDDNRDSALSMSLMLSLGGDDVRVAHDGVEAVQVATQFRPQIILMDMGMPRLNGYEATREIRKHPWSGSTIILALTGWGQDGDKARSQEAGCDGHLVKPVGLPELETAIQEARSRNGCSGSSTRT